VKKAKRVLLGGVAVCAAAVFASGGARGESPKPTAVESLVSSMEAAISRAAEGDKWWARLSAQLSTLSKAASQAARAVGRKREAPYRITERLLKKAVTANLDYIESAVKALESRDATDLAGVARLLLLGRVLEVFGALESMEDDVRCKAARAALLAVLTEGERPVQAGESCERAKTRLMGVLAGPSAANESSEQIAALVNQSLEGRVIREVARITRRYPSAWIKGWVKAFASAQKRLPEVEQEMEKGAYKTFPAIKAAKGDGYAGLVVGRVWSYRVTDTQATEDQEVEAASRTGESIHLKFRKGSGTERLQTVKSSTFVHDPIRVGTKWSDGDADFRISRVDIETATELGIFRGCIEVRILRGTDEERIVYAPALGKILREKFSALTVGSGKPRLMLVEREEITGVRKVEKKEEKEESAKD
jgi:hypothetical protein